MLSVILGPLDQNTAFFLVALCVGLTITITTMIGKRRSKQELTQEFELAKIQEANKRELNLYTSEQSWLLENKKTEQNLITSHSSSTSNYDK